MLNAHVVGSLLRPVYLKEARQRWLAGDIPAEEYKRLEDRAVEDAIALQERVGFEIVTDGEQRRQVFADSLADAVDGFAERPGPQVKWYGGGDGGTYVANIVTQLVVVERLRRRRSLVRDEYLFARAIAHKAVKVTLPSPLTLAFFWSPAASTAAYADPFDMFADAAAILRGEVERLQRLGCEHVQIDAPEIGMLVDPGVRRHFDALGISARRMLGEGIESIEGMISGVRDVRFSLHLCRGNSAGRWMGAGGYQSIARHVFPRLRSIHAFLLEFDGERCGSFDALRAVPDDKEVVLGLVSTKTNEIEPMEALVARLREASRYFPLRQLGISTQCGFASVAEGNPVSEDVQERKLRLVMAVAGHVFAGAAG